MRIIKPLMILFLIGVFTNIIQAQFSLDAELRTRGEANNGYRTLPTENSQTAFYISQRTRLNLSFKKDKFSTYISLQDVRLWGQEDYANKTGIQSSSIGLDLSQAWFNWNFAKNWGLKTGRQIWDYDDSRILSTRNWHQTALSYDAILLHLDKDDFHFHLGSSINNTYVSHDRSGLILEDNPYYEPLEYRIKYFNFLWLQFHASKHFSISIAEYISSYLGRNTTATYYNLSTTTLHFNYHSSKLNILANAFYQYGKKSAAGKNKNAFMFTLSGKYQSGNITWGLGFDYLSGEVKDASTTPNKTAAFDLLYGARYKYYGWMNYYLISKDTRDGGLMDLHLPVKWSVNNKNSIGATYHVFWLAQDVYSDMCGGDYSYLNKKLGGELDMIYTYKYDKSFNIQTRFSYYFATETTEFVKGVTKGTSTSPFWINIMLTYTPKLFEK